MARGISAEAREDILVQAFLTCPNISEISKKTKIPRPTIYTVIHTDSFQRKYSEARNEAITGAIAYLQGKLGECAAVLVNTATDTEVPAQIRVNAANAALSQCSQWTKNVDMIEYEGKTFSLDRIYNAFIMPYCAEKREKSFSMVRKGYIYGDWKDRSKPYRKIACILLDVKSVMENYSASASAQRELRNIIAGKVLSEFAVTAVSFSIASRTF